VIDDNGFLRHIDAQVVDRQVIEAIQAQVNSNKELVEEGIMKMIARMTCSPRRRSTYPSKHGPGLEHGLPQDARQWLA